MSPQYSLICAILAKQCTQNSLHLDISTRVYTMNIHSVLKMPCEKCYSQFPPHRMPSLTHIDPPTSSPAPSAVVLHSATGPGHTYTHPPVALPLLLWCSTPPLTLVEDAVFPPSHIHDPPTSSPAPSAVVLHSATDPDRGCA